MPKHDSHLAVDDATSDYHDPGTLRAVLTDAKTGDPIAGRSVAFTMTTDVRRAEGDGVVPIAGRTLTLTLGTGGSAQSCTGTTNASRSTICAVTVNQPLGPGTVSAEFAGDAFYEPSSDSATTILFEFPAGGLFVIGDGNAAAGSGVTFWGAQWTSLNTLSGGTAPASFKGFASGAGTTPPACGTGWSTRPGNSSGPPSSVPSFMGTIVASTVTKSGSTISGDAARIVVVETAAGYAPNPGHAGTGTVVATIC